MAWIKDTISRSPKTVYTAPQSAHPMTKIIYDPEADNPWTVEYEWLTGPSEVLADVETAMEL